MQNNIRQLLIASAASTLLLASPAQAEFDLSAGLASQYLREGISLTGSSMTVNGGLNWRHSSGLYAGVWGSRIDNNQDDLVLETDLYLGLYQPLSDKVAIDLAVTRYRFHGDDNSYYQDYSELGASLLVGERTKFGWRGSKDYLGKDRSWQALEAAYIIPVNDFHVELFVANYHWLSKDTEIGAAYNDSGKSHYWHFGVGVERTWKDWDYRVAFERSIVGGNFNGGSNFSFGITKHFKLTK